MRKKRRPKRGWGEGYIRKNKRGQRVVLLDLDKWFLGEREFRERKKSSKQERFLKEIKKEKENETERREWGKQK